ncbi:hypothetical protein BgiBS90_009875, partial [Biomphalaria glabrata]
KHFPAGLILKGRLSAIAVVRSANTTIKLSSRSPFFTLDYPQSVSSDTSYEGQVTVTTSSAVGTTSTQPIVVAASTSLPCHSFLPHLQQPSTQPIMVAASGPLACHPLFPHLQLPEIQQQQQQPLQHEQQQQQQLLQSIQTSEAQVYEQGMVLVILFLFLKKI